MLLEPAVDHALQFADLRRREFLAVLDSGLERQLQTHDLERGLEPLFVTRVLEPLRQRLGEVDGRTGVRFGFLHRLRTGQAGAVLKHRFAVWRLAAEHTGMCSAGHGAGQREAGHETQWVVRKFHGQADGDGRFNRGSCRNPGAGP